MISLTTLFQLSHGLVVAVLVALGSIRGDAQLGAMRAAVDAGQIAAAREAQSSLLSVTATPCRPKRVDRPPSSRYGAVSELEDEAEGSSAPITRSVRVDLPSSHDVVAKRGPVRLVVLVSHGMPTGHPRGPPAARTV